MRRLTAWVGLGCSLALLLFFYRAVLFQGEQFGFRDSAHYYYPLYHKVQEEWNAGRIPLWDTSENAGMPLIGNPTAAVLYPLKVIYAVLPYAWATRFYTMAHTALALVGMIILLRSWGTSGVGSMIAGISYAFGSPVVFQYCNIIFLVGAAWIPWGILAIDQWIRLKRPSALALLAVVLAMQVLGGDPESAYLLGLCGGGYAVGLVWVARFGPWKGITWKWLSAVMLGIVAWVAITLYMAWILPGFRPEPGEKLWGPIVRWYTTGKMPVFRKEAFEGPVSSVLWTSTIPKVVAAFWGLVGVILVGRWWRRRRSNGPLVPLLGGLVASAVLAGGLSAAQMVPVYEFTSLTSRATDEAGHDMYPFSLEPYRLIETVVPGVFGRRFGRPVTWVDMILPGLTHRVWVPTLYFGGMTVILGFSTLGFRGGPPWRAWLTGIAAVSLLGSFGEFASPLTYARFISSCDGMNPPAPEKALDQKNNVKEDPNKQRMNFPSLVKALGPLDLKMTNAVRLDGYLRNGDGSPYFLMSELLPGFSQFRFPSKLFTFTTLAMTALGGLGWDRVVAGRSRWVVRLGFVGSGLSLIALVTVLARHEWITRKFEAGRQLTMAGKMNIPATIVDIQMAFLQSTIVLGAMASLVLLARAPRVRPRDRVGENDARTPIGPAAANRSRVALAGVLALILTSVDIALVNQYLIKTVPQSDFEFTPKVMKLIEAAERLDPSPGPYRIHRMPLWNPVIWREANSEDRVRDFVQWEHDTIQPKYGLLHGVEYTRTIGVAELYDQEWFFAPFPRSARAEAAKILGINPGDQIVVQPRRGYDLWGTRYFVIPALPSWNDVDRGTASFMTQTERIYPPPEIFSADMKDPKFMRWANEEDLQILKNKSAFPRAWIVHDASFRKPITGLTRSTRRESMEDILFSNDVFWQDPQRKAYDPRQLAWLEVDDDERLELTKYTRGTAPLSGEKATVVTKESGPQRVVLDVNLALPGIVVLADIYYPGWKLSIDGKPAPILRANRAMRGAAVLEGKHRLVYTYEPRSFQVGAAISVGSMVVFVGFLVWSYRRREPR